MSYVQLTTKERGQIEVMTRLGYSIRAIGRELNLAPSTISRELRRAKHQAERAQSGYPERKKNCGAKLKHTVPILKLIQLKLLETWSPEQIENRLFEGKLCFKTIYRWIYDGRLELPLTVLRQKGQTAEITRDARPIFRWHPDCETAERRPHTKDVRSLGTGYGRLQMWEKQSVCRNVCRAQNALVPGD